jgi:hypothetical protein
LRIPFSITPVGRDIHNPKEIVDTLVMCDNVEVMKFTITHRISIAAIVVPAVLAILFNNDAAKTNVNGSGNAIAVGANANAIVNNFHPVERHMNDERWNEILSIINENKVTSKNVIDVVVDGPGGEKFDYANEIVDRLKKEGFQTSPESVSTSFDGHVNGVIYRFDPNNLHRFVIKVGDNN